MSSQLSILITLLLSVLGFSPDAKVDVRDHLGGRFTTLDPMATDYGHLSPYSNCAANPLKYTDPDGRILRDENGNIPKGL